MRTQVSHFLIPMIQLRNPARNTVVVSESLRESTTSSVKIINFDHSVSKISDHSRFTVDATFAAITQKS